jgi:hypothetical protein
MKLKSLLIYGGLLTLLVLVIAGITLLTIQSGNDDNTDVVFDPSIPLKPGFVWIDGEWYDPPYFVENDASVIRIDAQLVWRVTRPAIQPQGSGAANQGALGDLLDAAANRLVELGGASEAPPSDATVADLTQLVESLPGSAAVELDRNALAITDESGQTGYLILQRPDLPEQRDSVRVLQAVTTRWKADLANGDVLLFNDDVTVEVPAPNARAFLNELTAIYDLPESEQATAMLDLIGSETMAEALLESGRPAAWVGKRLAAGMPEGEAAASEIAAAPTQQPTAESGLVTPSSNKVYIFQPIDVEGLGWCSTEALITAAKRQGYQIVHFRASASTIAATQASSGRAGIFFFCGNRNGIEPVGDSADAVASTASLQQELGLTADDVYPVVSLKKRVVDNMLVPQYYIGAGAGFFAAQWQSANSIVYLSECDAADLAAGFQAREVIADSGCFSSTTQGELDAEFFESLGSGGPVGTAFDSALGGTDWTLLGDGMGQTRLSSSGSQP